MKKFNCEWLVVIIIHDFKHPKYSPIIDEIVKEFEDEGISDDNCVLYIHDELVDADNGIFKTSFNRLERDVINTSRFVFNKVTDAEFRFDKGRTWEKVLQFIKEEYISFKRSVMITLSDGAGFGILGDTLIRENETKYIHRRYFDKAFLSGFTENFAKSHSAFQLQGDYVKITNSKMDTYCKALQILWISELVDSIKNSFGKVDILMMSNCYMQTFETGWLLRKNVRYFIAPETLLMAQGYSYSGLLANIKKNAKAKPAEIIKTIRNEFVDKWLKVVGREGLGRVTVMTSDLKRYWAFKFFFDQISRKLARLSDKDLMLVIKMRQEKVMNVTNDPTRSAGGSLRVDLVDLNYFFSELLLTLKAGFWLKLNVKMFSWLTKTYLKDELMHIGESFAFFDENEVQKFGIRGISIYLPGADLALEAVNLNDIANCAYFGKPKIVKLKDDEIPVYGFTKTTLWDEFLKRVLSKLSSGIEQSKIVN